MMGQSLNFGYKEAKAAHNYGLMKLINDDSVEVPIESSVKASNHLSALITITQRKMIIGKNIQHTTDFPNG